MLDFKVLNRQLSALAVIRSLGLEADTCTRHKWRGRCPFHQSGNLRSRSLAVDLQLRAWYCHRCKVGGDLIDLWAGVRGIGLYRAAEELLRTFG